MPVPRVVAATGGTPISRKLSGSRLRAARPAANVQGDQQQRKPPGPCTSAEAGAPPPQRSDRFAVRFTHM
ncbi:hypothetical protein [Streptomyces sp. NPDC006971]|uniref:hypothetical protein n=1 Tax=Streptomyces sp. NPDC006971 TaxID=3154784 RepID=UPI00340B9BC9